MEWDDYWKKEMRMGFWLMVGYLFTVTVSVMAFMMFIIALLGALP